MFVTHIFFFSYSNLYKCVISAFAAATHFAVCRILSLVAPIGLPPSFLGLALLLGITVGDLDGVTIASESLGVAMGDLIGVTVASESLGVALGDLIGVLGGMAMGMSLGMTIVELVVVATGDVATGNAV
jgi:hypothetical protein